MSERKPYTPPTVFKLSLCQPCAAKLRTVLALEGEKALGDQLRDLVCDDCWAKTPRGTRPDKTNLKGPSA